MASRLSFRTLSVFQRLWALPWSVLGLALAAPALATGAQARWVAGVCEVSGGSVLRWWADHAPFGTIAITLGHVVLGRDAHTLNTLRVHEHAHVRQYERWGLLFVPAYAVSCAWQWVRGRHPYLDNGFEVQARQAELRQRAAAPRS